MSPPTPERIAEIRDPVLSRHGYPLWLAEVRDLLAALDEANARADQAEEMLAELQADAIEARTRE